MSTPEIITVNSEALEAQIRELLPSQNGFGSELQASNVIMPIIDLTPAAEGSILRTDLQTALSFGNQTSYSVGGATATITTQTGFVRITGNYNLATTISSDVFVQIFLNDGASVKQIYGWNKGSAVSYNSSIIDSYDFIVFLNSGESVRVIASTDALAVGSVRQIATINGTLVNPVGFTSE
tara:strand:- start:175 stop:717 length:543 start_codon:yes stop_codon:yes gene_type:complete